MMDDLKTPAHDSGRRENGQYTTLLRQALAEVIELSSSAVEPLESGIESEYAKARSEAQRRFDMDKEKIERELRLQIQEVHQESEAQIKDAESEYEGRLSTLKVEIQQRRKRVMQTAVELESKAEKKSRINCWSSSSSPKGPRQRRSKRASRPRRIRRWPGAGSTSSTRRPINSFGNTAAATWRPPNRPPRRQAMIRALPRSSDRSKPWPSSV
jgi:hypothetical protein